MSDDLGTDAEKLLEYQERAVKHQEKMAQDLIRSERRRHFDWDMRGLIAMTAVVGAFALAGIQLFTGSREGANIPGWAAGLVAAIATFYFISKSTNGRP